MSDSAARSRTAARLWAARLARMAAFDEEGRRRAFAEGVHECAVCMTAVGGAECTRLSACGHVFCNACLRAHFVQQMNDGSALKIGAVVHLCG